MRIKAFGTHREAVNIKYSMIEMYGFTIDENTGVIKCSSTTNYQLNPEQIITVSYKTNKILNCYYNKF